MSNQEKSYKLAENDAMESKRVMNTMTTSIALSTFIAGFAYYEMGRNDSQKYVDEAYVWLMTMALGWAILSVGVGTFTLYYLDRCRTIAQKNAFIMVAKPLFIRGCFRTFVLALYCYCLGLSRCGWVYFQDCTWGMWYTFAVGLLMIPLAFLPNIKIARSQNKVQVNQGFDHRNLIDHSTLVQEHNARGGIAADELHVLMTNEANTIANRAIYITGFVQSGVTSYIATDNPLGSIYLIIVVLALACAVASGFAMSVESIFLFDTNPEVQPAFAVILRSLHNGLVLSYSLSVIFLCLSVMFMGWGCAFPNEAWCTLLFGLLALFTLVVTALTAIRRMTALHGVETSPKDEHSDDSFNADYNKQLINATGSQATISSGFVFYNIIMFSSDVLPLTQTSYELKITFLLVCAATLATGVIASGVDSIITLTLTNLGSPKKREAFLRQSSGMISVCVRMYQVSMIGFLGGFALVGFVKFPPIMSTIFSYHVPVSLIPTVFALGAAVLVGLGWISLRILWSNTTVEPIKSSESFESSSFEDDRVRNRMKCQDMVSNRALFFGGFAYLTLCSFSSSFAEIHRDVTDQWYLIPLCCTFALSVVVIIWSANYSINNELCKSQEHRRRMRESSTTFYYVHLAVSILATIAFPIAFISIESYNTYGVLIRRGMCLLFILLPIVLWKIMKLGTKHTEEEVSTLLLSPQQASKSQDNNNNNNNKLREKFRRAGRVLITDPTLLDEPERFLDQVEATATQSAFIAGNVFFEILFADSGGCESPWVCEVYFSASSITFISGCAVIGVATAISFVVTQLGMDQGDKKAYIASRVRFMKNLERFKVKKILFGLSSLCVFSWVTALTALGAAKYKVKQTLWEPSFSTGLFAALLLSWSFYRLKTISERIMPKDGDENKGSPKMNYGSMET